MKKLLISSVAVASLFAQPTIEQLQKQLEALQAQIQELKKAQEAQAKAVKEVKTSQENTAASLQQVKRAHYEDHINFHFGIRTSVDALHYKTKSGKKFDNTVLSNKVSLTGLAKVNDNLKATLKLEAYNAFGMNYPRQNANSNWTASETPDDTSVRVKEAFFNYFFGEDGEYMFSAGRRPSVGGYPANLRNNEVPTSPVAHLVNMEFDGFSLWFKPEAFGSLGEDYGTNIKFCFGRGFSSINNASYAYAKGNLPNNDMGGFLLIPYNDDQYSIWWENIYAWNVMGMNDNNQMEDLGNYVGSNLIFKADGIGDGISDFLDDTKAFISFAWTKTLPDSGKKMLGTTDSKTGWSVWIGADMDGLGDNDRWGFNYVHGSKYFRAMTYGEDTLAGSIAAVRGNAYEAYYDKQLMEHLTANFRATYFDYDYAGSDAYFGNYGNPDNADFVEKASDIRAYIKYQY
jgi:hypothetical protein